MAESGLSGSTAADRRRVAEIVQQYEVDGIHLDDYFYPTTETAFDAAAFADVKADNLNQFRLSQVNEMIQQIYSTVKAKSPSCC